MKRFIIILLHSAYWCLYLVLIALFFMALPSPHKPSFGKAVFAPQLFFTILLPAVAGFYLFYFFLFNTYLKNKKIIGAILMSILFSLAVAGFCLVLIRILGGPYLLPGNSIFLLAYRLLALLL